MPHTRALLALIAKATGLTLHQLTDAAGIATDAPIPSDECRACGGESRVKQKRQTARGVRRRRECVNPACRRRWTTYETFAPSAVPEKT